MARLQIPNHLCGRQTRRLQKIHGAIRTRWSIRQADRLSVIYRDYQQNGNMLLNVGPKGDGEIPEEDQNMLLGSGLTAGLSTEGTVPMSFTGTYIGMFAENGSSAFQEFQVNYVLPDE